jgi:hypothetical protein
MCGLIGSTLFLIGLFTLYETEDGIRKKLHEIKHEDEH